MLHAFAQGILSFSIFRSLLGVAEAGNWPGAAKANAEWFPTKERALAQGIFNSTDDEKKFILSGQRNQDIDQDGNYDEGYTPTTNQLFQHKESWGVIIASAAIDPIWWLFIVWIPIYLSEVFGMEAAGLTYLVAFITTGGNYTPAFIIGGALAIIALLAVWFLCPKIEPLKPKEH